VCVCVWGGGGGVCWLIGKFMGENGVMKYELGLSFFHKSNFSKINSKIKNLSLEIRRERKNLKHH
jgi:hypothetical protein